MIKAYFISDIHLGITESEEEDKREGFFLKFLNEIKDDATHIYIIGDLFDFWFEYKHVIPKKHFECLYTLKLLSDKGIEIHYFAGNHDFSLGTFFDKSIGIKTWQDEYTFNLGDKKFYLWHGDGLGKNDGGYRVLKKILRNKWNLRFFRLFHPDYGIPFARFISGSSRKHTNKLNHKRDESEYCDFAIERFNEGFDYVMMGHRHNPLVHQVGHKKYINLGDWIEHFSYAIFDGEDLHQKFYKQENS